VGELLLRKAVAIRDRIARIRGALPSDPRAVAADERLEAFVCFHLFLLAQDVIDMAVHLVAAHGLDVPSTQRGAFDALSRAGLLSAESAASMGALASLRNRIAHQYGDIDVIRLVREAPPGLDAVETFLHEITPALPS
jgi:uncharacterized protein YutE (UPF0331/DUF86 family)